MSHKFDNITKKHIIEAAGRIDKQGIHNDNKWSEYFVVVNGKEYPFKEIVRQAYSIENSNSLKFQSNESNRNYIENLGFKIEHYEEGKRFGDPTPKNKIARITWNTNHWVKPSGKNGKSTNPNSYEKENGYGHEEWLFDTEKVIEGYKHGFLEAIHQFRTKYKREIFNIFLYTYNSCTKEYFWVATLRNVEILSIEEARRVTQIYKRNGWLNEMKDDLQNLNLNYSEIDEWAKDDEAPLFNIRFKAKQLQDIPTNLIQIDNNKEIPSKRYRLMEIQEGTFNKYANKEKKRFCFEESGSTKGELASKKTQTRHERCIESDLKHNEIQQKFQTFLQRKYGENLIKRECIAYGASRIDITRKTDTGYIFYEIKSYSNLRTSIREALGQLLEYCFYPDKQVAKKIVLVSDISPSPEIKNYIKEIKRILQVPFSYIYFDLEKNKIGMEI